MELSDETLPGVDTTDETLASVGDATPHPDDPDATVSVGTDDTVTSPHAGGGPGRTEPGRPGSLLGRGQVVGRYVVLAKLGAGGMGVVYAAYDPDLDRKVALKMLLERGVASHDARARLLREAQALAKFSHPEIVAIHDVGVHAAGVWLAMEFVAGQTLGAWAKQAPRRWPEIVEVMLAAGRGVAAAHAAGLVHRDLKPDNIMVGDDGRVRVMDFGLTRAESGFDPEAIDPAPVEPESERPREDLLVTPLTQHGSLLGTPAYMAPEQFAGVATITAAADQFSFCVTLWQLLYGQRPFAGDSVMALAAAVLAGELQAPPAGKRVPAWLRKLVERGLASEPSARWPSMEALLDALARGQTRARRRGVGLAIGVAGLIGAGVFGWQRWDHAQRVAACEAEAASVDAIWNDAARTKVRDGLLASEVGFAATSAERVLPRLDAHAAGLRAATETACREATVDRRWDADTHARARWCLSERRLELGALVELLAAADARVAESAVTAAAGLDDPSLCVDPRALVHAPAPPTDGQAELLAIQAELAQANALASAGKIDEGLAKAEAAEARAEALDWPPLVAAAVRLEGALLKDAGRYPEAEAASQRAYLIAAEAGAWGVAATAATELAYVIGSEQSRTREGRTWVALAEVAARYAGDPLGMREASRRITLGAMLEADGDYAAAQLEHEQAQAIWERVLGPDHPYVALALNNLGNDLSRQGKLDEAAALQARALAIREQAYGPDHPEVASTYANLGNLDFDRGQFDAAIANYERAMVLWEPSLGAGHPIMGMLHDSLGNAYANKKEFAEAKPEHERAREIFSAALPPDHPYLAVNLGNLAIAEFALDPAAALVTLERAMVYYDAHEGMQQGEPAARFLYARALESTGGDVSKARAQAELARDGFAEAGEVKAEYLAEVNAWLAEHEPAGSASIAP